MIKNIDELINKGSYPPILLMFGEEEFLLEEAFSKLIKSLVSSEEAAFNLDILDAEDSEIDIRRIVETSDSYPFMSDSRVIAVKNFDKLFKGKKSKKTEKEAEPFLKYLDSPQPTTVLILIADLEKLRGVSVQLLNPKKKSTAEKKLKSAKFPFDIILDKHEWIEFPRVWDNQKAEWVRSRLKAAGKKIDPNALELLLTQSSPELRDLNNEIEKIVIYLGDKQNITYDDVNFVVGSSRQYNVFELQNAIGERSLTKSLKITEKILNSERKEMLIIGVLTKYFTSLWRLLEERGKSSNSYQLANAIGVNPYFIKEYEKALTKYKPYEINNAFRALLNADKEIKTSSGKIMYIMQKMIMDIVQPDG